MIHPLVDHHRWLARYPLTGWRADVGRRIREAAEKDPRAYPTLEAAQRFLEFWSYPPDSVCSPKDFAITEQMRIEAGLIADREGGVPVDVLIPALGEPARRECSKIGGLPYLAAEDWPSGREEQPMSFIAQLCFADSRDILSAAGTELPGDVLLIFAEAKHSFQSEKYGAVRFLWRPLRCERLIEPDDVPRDQAVRFTPTYFERYRSAEFDGSVAEADLICSRYQASKIGGFPVWQQSEDEAPPGRFIGALHSISPHEEEFPFPNVARRTWDQYLIGQKFFMLGDAGTLYLFVDNDGETRFLMQGG